MGEPGQSSCERELIERIERLEARVRDLPAVGRDEPVCLVCFSGDWDRLFAAFTIACGALSLGREVHMFFTFWALSALRRPGKRGKNKKSAIQSMLAAMLPDSPGNAPLSRLNFAGVSKVMLGRLMKEKGIGGLDALMAEAVELGAHFYVCDTSAEMFGMNCEELSEGYELKSAGVATFLSLALKSRMALFI